jgi:catechol 2,3-dioxygenase-like lactoylglutathione lyase family enzyme
LHAQGTLAYSDAMIKGIKFASVPVSNQDISLTFYTEKLGFVVMTDQHFSETQRWIELGIPGAPTRIVLFTPDAHRDRIGTFTGISFYSDDVEATYETLKARGVEFAKPPKKEDWGTSSIFKDPDGNQFVLSSK